MNQMNKELLQQALDALKIAKEYMPFYVTRGDVAIKNLEEAIAQPVQPTETQRVRLRQSQIHEAQNCRNMFPGSDAYIAFTKGVRWAESAHGIGS